MLQTLSEDTKEILRQHNLLKKLVRAEITKNAVDKIKIDKEEIDAHWDKFLLQNKLNNDEELNAFLVANGLNIGSLRWQIELPKRIKKYCEINFLHKAEARFLAKKESLDRVIYSLLRVKDGFVARELYLKIISRESNFADLASSYSQGQEANTNGIIGPVPLNQAHPILAEKLRASQPNQLIEPFNVEGWWLVVRLEKYESAQFNDSTALTMAQELFGEWIEEQVVCKMGQL